MHLFSSDHSHKLDPLQRFSLSLMPILVLITFVGTNMHAYLWQSSEWLVSTVLPAVVVDLTNEERLVNNAAQLQRSATLDRAAKAKAEHMATNGYFAHYAPDGTTPWQFFQDEGYVYAHAGENLAVHFTDSAELVEAWMLSPAHRKNIVDGKFAEIGVGTAKGTFDGYDTVFVVQLFGTPAELIVPPELPQVAVGADEVVIDSFNPLNDQEVAVLAASDPSEVTEITPEVVAVAETSLVPLPAAEELESDITIAPVALQEQETATPTAVTTSLEDEILVVRTHLATSSGLAVATMIDQAPYTHAGATITAYATQPSKVLQTLYVALATLIVLSLGYALVIEARRLHFVQVAYSLVLLALMGGLWLVHTTLISGAIVA